MQSRHNTKASRLTGWLEQTGRYPHGRTPLKVRRNEGEKSEMSATTFFALLGGLAILGPLALTYVFGESEK